MVDAPFTKLLQIGIVVDDLEKYMKKYTDDYGIGPWNVHDFNDKTVTERTVHGASADYRMRLALCDFLNVQWELIEPYHGESIYTEFLEEHGPGIHHVAMATSGTHDETIDLMKSRGVEVNQTGNYGGMGYSYLDLVSELGIVVEIYNPEDGFVHPEPVAQYPE